jgi:hypothetical protein
MPKRISKEYCAQNVRLHAADRVFGAGGHKWAARVISYLDTSHARSFLDYGCGKGTLTDFIADRIHLTRLSSSTSIRRYDPATFPDEPVPAEFVTCLDVLEHIEPLLLENVLSHIASLISRQGLLAISLKASDKTLPDGRNAHLIVEGQHWWLDTLRPHFPWIQVEPMRKPKGGELVVLVRP